jgi:hypothetical protein
MFTFLIGLVVGIGAGLVLSGMLNKDEDVYTPPAEPVVEVKVKKPRKKKTAAK